MKKRRVLGRRGDLDVLSRADNRAVRALNREFEAQ